MHARTGTLQLAPERIDDTVVARARSMASVCEHRLRAPGLTPIESGIDIIEAIAT
jgi:hypothetical protein